MHSKVLLLYGVSNNKLLRDFVSQKYKFVDSFLCSCYYFSKQKVNRVFLKENKYFSFFETIKYEKSLSISLINFVSSLYAGPKKQSQSSCWNLY